MPRKPKPYMTIDSKEEFEKEFKEIFNSGYEKGFEEGKEYALSFILELVADRFTHNEQISAQYILKNRREKKFKMEQSRLQSIKDSAVKEYIDSMGGVQDEHK